MKLLYSLVHQHCSLNGRERRGGEGRETRGGGEEMAPVVVAGAALSREPLLTCIFLFFFFGHLLNSRDLSGLDGSDHRGAGVGPQSQHSNDSAGGFALRLP